MYKIAIILASVLLNAIAQLLIKKGVSGVGGMSPVDTIQHLSTLIGNIWLWGAAVCYIISIILWMSVLSQVEVNYAYPFLSVGYIFVAIVSFVVFGESLSATKVLGIIVICIGVILISHS